IASHDALCLGLVLSSLLFTQSDCLYSALVALLCLRNALYLLLQIWPVIKFKSRFLVNTGPVHRPKAHSTKEWAWWVLASERDAASLTVLSMPLMCLCWWREK